MMQLDAKYLQLIQDILKKYPYTFYAFGSRVKGSAKPFSDLDLFCLDAMPPTALVELEEEFEESDLPFKIEIILAENCSAEFKARITPDLVQL